MLIGISFEVTLLNTYIKVFIYESVYTICMYLHSMIWWEENISKN